MFKECDKMVIKIAIIGTHGTGKKTKAHELVAMLKKQGKNTGFLDEVVRGCPFPVNQETTKKSQEWTMLNQFIKEIEQEDKFDYFVCVRSILDAYIYYSHKFGRHKTLEPFVSEHMKTYNYLFKVPINSVFLQDDGFRATDKYWQKEIDELFDDALSYFGVSFHEYKSLKDTLDIILKEKNQNA